MKNSLNLLSVCYLVHVLEDKLWSRFDEKRNNVSKK